MAVLSFVTPCMRRATRNNSGHISVMDDGCGTGEREKKKRREEQKKTPTNDHNLFCASRSGANTIVQVFSTLVNFYSQM